MRRTVSASKGKWALMLEAIGSDSMAVLGTARSVGDAPEGPGVKPPYTLTVAE